MSPSRETFGSRLGLVATMIGVAVGLGNVWRFPYMAGRFGGSAFILSYVVAVVLLGIPALTAEWTLGRHTRRGPVGAFARAGLPLGRQVGWLFFLGVTAATAYYTNAVGWVLAHAVGALAQLAGLAWDPAAILPPEDGFDVRSFALQAGATALVVAACAGVLVRGLRAGIEKMSRWLLPALFVALVVIIVRTLTLPGSWAGVERYLLRFDLEAFTPRAMMAAVGQAFFSLSLGGTFMVVYGSYLGPRDKLGPNAAWTGAGDLGAGLLAALAILPAVFALGLEPASGPPLIFMTLPRVFAEIPFGAVFGLLFFAGLFGAAYLSDVAAFEVLVAGLTDNTRLRRGPAVGLVAGAVFLLALVPMINLKIFVPWDLTFGSGMQILGSLLAVVTVGWLLARPVMAAERGASGAPGWWPRLLALWIRFVVPGALIAIGAWWVLTEVLGLIVA